LHIIGKDGIISLSSELYHLKSGRNVSNRNKVLGDKKYGLAFSTGNKSIVIENMALPLVLETSP
jgi:hypothetical protein